MVLLGMPLVSSYRLLIVNMPLTDAFWPKFTIQIFGVQSVSPLGEIWGRKGSELIQHVAAEQIYVCFWQFYDKAYRLVTTHTLQTTDRRTTSYSYHKRDLRTVG